MIIYPLWLGTMSALLKASLEQVIRPGFAFEANSKGFPGKLLKGRSARMVITMGMPGLFYQWFFGTHSLKSLERNILKFCGIGPIRETILGMVDAGSVADGANQPIRWFVGIGRVVLAGGNPLMRRRKSTSSQIPVIAAPYRSANWHAH